MGASPVTVAAHSGRVHILKLLVESYNGNLFHTDATGVTCYIISTICVVNEIL